LKARRKDVKAHLKALAPSIVGLGETKVKPHKANRVTKALPHGWQCVNNYALSNKGRIWLCWDVAI